MSKLKLACVAVPVACLAVLLEVVVVVGVAAIVVYAWSGDIVGARRRPPGGFH